MDLTKGSPGRAGRDSSLVPTKTPGLHGFHRRARAFDLLRSLEAPQYNIDEESEEPPHSRHPLHEPHASTPPCDPLLIECPESLCRPIHFDPPERPPVVGPEVVQKSGAVIPRSQSWTPARLRRLHKSGGGVN